MAPRPTILRLSGAEIRPYLADLARLRMTAFRDFPYLRDCDFAEESEYLERYAASEHGVIIVALTGAEVVGASTGIPIADEFPAFAAPFSAAGDDPARIFYGGEALLLPAYRDTGVYRQFFLQREAYAREAGAFDTFAFCAVERPDDHRLRPRDYLPLESTWARYGYTKHPELLATLTWKDIDTGAQTEKSLMFWLKSLIKGGNG